MAPTFTPFAGLFRGPAALRAKLAELLAQVPSRELSERAVRSVGGVG